MFPRTMQSYFSRVPAARVILVTAVLASAVTIAPGVVAQSKTVKDGVYTTAQAKRGEAIYEEQCASCHAPNLAGGDGPALVGADFVEAWDKRTLSDLVEKIQTSMPANAPGSLTRKQTADVVAFMLHIGLFPAGQTELAGEAGSLKEITIAGPSAADVRVPGVPSHPGSTTSIPFSLPVGSGTFTPLPSGPTVFQTLDYRIRVVTVVDGLSRPWSLAFLPSGEMLVTERTGQLRIIRNGVLDPQPIAGVPKVLSSGREGLMDVVLHPDFAKNGYLYLTYTKDGPPDLAAPPPKCEPGSLVRGWCFTPTPQTRAHTTALARGRLDGHTLKDVRDILVADWSLDIAAMGSRLVFGRDGMLYMTVSSRADDWDRAQKLDSLQGKVLRVRDDGTAPADNPFVKTAGARPEVFTLGHRNPLGLAVHPITGALWIAEVGPQGGDEINVLRAGGNYGWPKLSFGRDYGGEPYLRHDSVAGFESPSVFWAPAITPSGMTIYTGERFPKWKNNAFVGSLTYTHLERLAFNSKGQHVRSEWMLLNLFQRIRDVRQGPDGCLYVLTDANRGALLRIEPAD